MNVIFDLMILLYSSEFEKIEQVNFSVIFPNVDGLKCVAKQMKTRKSMKNKTDQSQQKVIGGVTIMVGFSVFRSNRHSFSQKNDEDL